MTEFQTKRIYEEASSTDGYRVLVDRIWPRGVSKERAQLDEWCKDVAPSTELRTWFGHDPEKYGEFKKRYEKELADNKTLESSIAEWKTRPKVTLLYGAHDETHNQAVVLRGFITTR